MIDTRVIETSALGDRSYLAHDGVVAVVVDPQRDVDRILAEAGRLGVGIRYVLDTHIHNDYVSGGRELARLTGAGYALAAADEVAFDRLGVADGDVLRASEHLRVRAVATPGHTYNHLCYVLEGPDGPVGVFTGGSLLFGTTGRTDLLGGEHTEPLARAQHASARRLAWLLPDGARVWPTHGFGSFCAAGQAGVDASNIGREKAANPALYLPAETFVTTTLAGLDTYPAYYAHMGAINTAGPPPIDLSPPERADADVLGRRIAAGEWVVDLRSRTAYADSYLVGTVSFGMDGPMATWLGWLVDWGAPLTLLGSTPEQVGAAQRELARIGIDRPEAAASGKPEQWAGAHGTVARLPVATFADLAAARSGRAPRGLPRPDVVLDVRRVSEWDASHIDGAVHVPLPDLTRRFGEVPAGTVWVHCGSGYRAATAASLLAGAGRDAVLVDDEYDNAEPAGLETRR